MNFSFWLILKDILDKTQKSAFGLFKIMIPILIIVKILQELNIIHYIASLGVVMKFVGIPEIYFLVWIVSILNTCYAAIPLIISFFANDPLTYAQITTLALMASIAHAIFIESAIAYKLKVNPYWIGFIRIFVALIVGFLFFHITKYFNLMQDQVNNFVIHNSVANNSFNKTFMDILKLHEQAIYLGKWLEGIKLWLFSQVKILITVFCVIFLVFVFVRIIRDFNLVNFVAKPFVPLLALMRITRKNAIIVAICYIIGISYGYGILKEEKDNSIFFRKAEPFKVITFIAIAHAMIEELLIFSILGANFWLLFLIRTMAAVVIVYILDVYILPKVSLKTRKKVFYY